MQGVLEVEGMRRMVEAVEGMVHVAVVVEVVAQCEGGPVAGIIPSTTDTNMDQSLPRVCAQQYSRLHNRLPVFCVQHNFVPAQPLQSLA